MKYFSTYILLFTVQCFAYEVFHQLKPGGSIESVALGGACTTIIHSKYSVGCNPALFSYLNHKELSMRVIGKADGTAINNTKKLLNKKIEEQTLRDLFTQSNFNSLSASTNIELINPYFLLGYTPGYYLSDILIFNPALPEVAMLLAKKEELYITSATTLNSLFGDTWSAVSMGATFKYSHMKSINQSFTLLEVSDSQRFNEIKKFNTSSGIETDIGIYIAPPADYLPNLAIVYKNAGSIYPDYNPESDDISLTLNHVFEQRIDFGLGYPVDTPIGKIDFSWVSPYSFDRDYSIEDSVAGARYNMDFFSILASGGYFHQSLGFMTNTDQYSIGLVFSNEKELRGFNSDYQKSVYLAVEASFL